MADYEERSLEDLTEEPSAHRLEELKAKGQVAQSRELTSTIVLLGMMGVSYFMAGTFYEGFSSLLKDTFSEYVQNPMRGDQSSAETLRTISLFGDRCFKILATAFLPIAVVGLILGVLGSVGQTGFIFTTETLNPDFNRLNPVSGFTRIFSTKSIVETLKALLKISIISAVTYFVIHNEIQIIPNLMSFSKDQLLSYSLKVISKVFATVVVFLFATSLLDYFIQWMRFRKQSMMTKAEAKQELKEREGDPQIRARIKSIQRETARKRMMKAVPQADVVITNPTHIAVAIIYDAEQGHAPKVVAKGGDFLAERIKKIAREHGIPTVENKPLARTLYKHVKVGQMIPRSLYQAVAEILAYVYRLKGKSKVRTSSPKDSGPTRSPSI